MILITSDNYASIYLEYYNSYGKGWYRSTIINAPVKSFESE